MRIDLDVLKSKSLLPDDSEIISEHNNVIVRSQSERMIARLGLLSAIQKRTTPGDLVYSHGLAWDMRGYDVVTAPLSPTPVLDGDVVISSYPLMDPLDWQRTTAANVYGKVSKMAQLRNVLSLEIESQLYNLDVSEYAQARLDQVRRHTEDGEEMYLADSIERQIEAYRQHYPFQQLRDSDPALVHGDLHTGNVVLDGSNPLLIDLDSVSVGPRLYDLASWHVRSLRGENVPTNKMIQIEKSVDTWNQESFEALMGWKIISSLTHTLRYEAVTTKRASINSLARLAIKANLPRVVLGND